MQFNPDIVAIGVSVGAVAVVVGILFQKWIDAIRSRPVHVNGDNFIGQWMEHYCKVTGSKIDEIVLAGYELKGGTVYRVESRDMYPELWLGEDE